MKRLLPLILILILLLSACGSAPRDEAEQSPAPEDETAEELAPDGEGPDPTSCPS